MNNEGQLSADAAGNIRDGDTILLPSGETATVDRARTMGTVCIRLEFMNGEKRHIRLGETVTKIELAVE